MKIISICSGKGGVGKTSVASGIALALAQRGYRVGLIDSDLESSSLADAWGIRGKDLRLQGGFIKPVERNGVKVVSLAMFLDEGFEDAPTLADEKLIHELQDQMMRSIDWGEIDFMILDLPPGSGPEIRGITRKVDGIIIVTAAQKMSEMPVRRLVKALKEDYHVPIIGIVENNPYNTEGGTGERISSMYKVPFLTSVPWDPDIARSMDASVPGYGDNTSSAPGIKTEYFENVVEKIEEYFGLKEEAEREKEELKERVIELRKQGASYKSISEQLGIPRSSVFEIVKKAGMTEKRGRRKKDARK